MQQKYFIIYKKNSRIVLKGKLEEQYLKKPRRQEGWYFKRQWQKHEK